MRSIICLGCLAVLLIAGCSFFKGADLVKGVPPMSTSLAGIAPTLDEMARMSPERRGRYLEQNWPHLDEDVVYFLRQMGKLSPTTSVRRVEFRFGSLNDVVAESSEGQRRGYFEDQLVALVYTRGAREPIAVIVQCLNGTFALPKELRSLQAVGSHTPQEQFTIGPREGLIHHVDFPVAIDLAERFNLPLFRGRTLNQRFQISPDQARRLESTTDRLQVTVYVVEGDRFDLINMTFTPSPKRAFVALTRLSTTLVRGPEAYSFRPHLF